jgi:hypothetical protein
MEKNIKEVWKELVSEEAKPSVSLPSFPAKQLKINHDEAVWMLEDQKLSNQISMFVVRTYMQTTIFNTDGRLVLKSQIYTPKERSKALVLYSLGGQFTNSLLTEALKHIEEQEFSVINSWILPVVITSQKEPAKAWWDAKRSSLKVLINLMKEEQINTLSGYELVVKLVKQKNGVKMWSEPKVMAIRNIEVLSENILKLAHEYLVEWEQFRIKYNASSFKQDNDISIEL